MLDDYDILKYLGLEIRDEHIIFFDDDSEEHVLEFSTIKSISFDKAYAPVETKVGFWFNKLFAQREVNGFVVPSTEMEDYRDIYELEIELTDHRVLSRKVKDGDIGEIREFLAEINKLITN
ncbi:hypothetical protein [Mangrovibacterium diazotrophicum]|uniref:Uncharacterized protein n=1 Tax=Mangrovibacterium diazotrophicum TaxID=1261403 RepID=A0A419W303_9BACT|nr:hypothetical protein [Mangrovibacterium diazotrophicum]RKD89855.1 hypothetical protein BC643_0188 [Mangrovibacterium diazotrophicum]